LSDSLPLPIIAGKGLVKEFSNRAGLWGRKKTLRAVDEVTLAIQPGETLALIGESGSGKSTLGRLLLGLTSPLVGKVFYRGVDLTTLDKIAYKRFRSDIQVVFQDTGNSLNPRHTIGASIQIPLRYNRGLTRQAAYSEATQLLQQVGLDPTIYMHRYPYQLSGGQRQRIGLARALASKPALIIADEPVSALDVSVQAQILQLMQTLQKNSELAYLFITHDFGVVRRMAKRVMVMYRGLIVEEGLTSDIFKHPAHPYTEKLLRAAPLTDPAQAQLRRASRVSLEFEVEESKTKITTKTNTASNNKGCRFSSNCVRVREICLVQVPPKIIFPNGQQAVCHFAPQVREISITQEPREDKD
jgi:oligopeptide/dipeptide ABC transporter ATP-binding protein